MIRTVQRWLVLVTCVLPFGFSVAVAAETKVAGIPFRYPTGRHKAAKLEYVNGLPVLVVEGTPEEIGEQIGQVADLVGPVRG